MTTNNETPTTGKRKCRDAGAEDETELPNSAKRACVDNRLRISFLIKTIRAAEAFNGKNYEMENPHTRKLEGRMKEIDTTIAPPAEITELNNKIKELQRLQASRAAAAAMPAAASPTQPQPAEVKTSVPNTTSAPRGRYAWIEQGNTAGIDPEVMSEVYNVLTTPKTVVAKHKPTHEKLKDFVTANDWLRKTKAEQVTLLVAAYYASKLTTKAIKRNDVQEQDDKNDTVQRHTEVFVKQEAVAESVENLLQLSGDP